MPCCWHGQKALTKKQILGGGFEKENTKTNIIHIRLITVQIHWVNANYKNKSTSIFLNPKGLYIGHLAKNDQRAQLIGVEKIRDNSQCELCPHHRKTSSECRSSAINNLNFDTPKLIISPTCLNTELNHNNTAKSYHSE